MKNQDILENQAKIVFLAIGSNLGNRKKNIERAKFFLHQNNIKFISVSLFSGKHFFKFHLDISLLSLKDM